MLTFFTTLIVTYFITDIFKILLAKQLQNKLNQKFNSGLKVDGKWGVNTANAVLRALKTTSPATKPPTATQQPATQQPATQQPTQKLPTLPAGTAQRPGQPTQLAGQNK